MTFQSGGDCADVRVSMPVRRRSLPRDRVVGAGLQTRLVGAVAALVLACGGFLAYRAIAAVDDAYRWTGRGRGGHRRARLRALAQLARPARSGAHPLARGAPGRRPSRPCRRRGRARRRRGARRGRATSNAGESATLTYPLVDARGRPAAVLRLGFAHDERAGAAARRTARDAARRRRRGAADDHRRRPDRPPPRGRPARAARPRGDDARGRTARPGARLAPARRCRLARRRARRARRHGAGAATRGSRGSRSRTR